jgi:hypothetical protein
MLKPSQAIDLMGIRLVDLAQLPYAIAGVPVARKRRSMRGSGSR